MGKRMILLGLAMCLAASTGTGLIRGQTVTISHSFCYNASSSPDCSTCKVDTGSGYCWATTCGSDSAWLVSVCAPSESGSTCNSVLVYFQNCSNCQSWQCGALNDMDGGHPNPYCDLGTCDCDTGTPDWTGGWSSWRGCTIAPPP